MRQGSSVSTVTGHGFDHPASISGDCRHSNPPSLPSNSTRETYPRTKRSEREACNLLLDQKLKMRGFIPPLPLRPDGVACDSAHGQRLLCVFVVIIIIIIIIIIMCKRFWVVSRRHFWC
jgi:hypothetical protein